MKKTADSKATEPKALSPKTPDPKALKEIIVVTTTTSRKDEAETLAAELVSRRLAACVQIVGPITSAFHWQGKVEHSEEWLCQIKSRRDKYAELEAVLKQLHPYDVPEIIATPAVLASETYARWLNEELDRKVS
jgi:periplasmic divalent cation tolerance protein